MSKTIQTTLTADSSQLRSEYAKAEKATLDYEKNIAKSQALARSDAADQLRVLQLQANGRMEAANALKEQIRLTMEARQLSARTGLTESAALATVQARVGYENRIAESKRKAAAAAERQLAIEKQLAATAQRRQTELGIIAGVEANNRRAISDAAKNRQNRIENLPRMGAQALPPLALTPRNLREMERAAAIQKDLRKQTQAAGKGGSDASLGILAFSQAVEDAQYGIKGVLNNIPQMVMSFGGTAGLAGALSLVAVGLYSFYKLTSKISGDDKLQKRLEADKKAAEDFDRAVIAIQDRYRQRKIDSAVDDRMDNRLTAELAVLEKLVALDKDRFRILQDESELRQQARDRQLSVLKAQEAFSLENSRTDEDRRKVESHVVDLTAIETQKRLLQEINDEEQKRKESGAQYNRIQEGLRESITRYQREIGVANSGLENLRRNLELDEKDLERIRAIEKADPTGPSAANDRRNMKILEDRIAKSRLLVSERDALIAQNKKLLDDALSTGRAAKDEMAASVRTSNLRIDALNEEIKLQGYLTASEKARLKLKQDRERSEEAARRGNIRDEHNSELAALRQEIAGHKEKAAWIRRESETRRGASSLAKELGISEKEALEMLRAKAALTNRVAKAEQQRQRRAAAREIGGDLSVLRLQAAGREREAKALQKEIELRNEAKRIAEQMGISESKALEIVRERQRLEAQIEANKNRRPRSGIYKLDDDESRRRRINAADGRRIDAGGGRRIHAGVGGLRTAAMEREGRGQRRDPGARDRAVAARYYERSISAQEEMVKIFNGLGVI